VHAPELVDLRLQALENMIPFNNLPVAFGDRETSARVCNRPPF
jgi:hypothetical protein